ncbi:MAG: hypothetical protein OJF51_004177 [Nitrospira sp.]|jgi:hypothetical protein|nr:MAG: hypothetical protein OJF51_004177 [Nitrospira sp.]
MLIIDTSRNTTGKLSCLVAHDVKTIIRYYNFSNSQKFPDKCLTLAEAQAISAQGMNIAVVFQQRQDRAEDFSEIKGYEAGRRAYRYALNDIDQPEGSGIYFGVDFDATDDEIKRCVIPYFQGVHRAFNEVSGDQPTYRVGVYGSGATSGALVKKKLCSLVWLAMSRGYRGTQDAINNGAYHLAQQAPEKTVCQLDIDYNSVNPEKTDFGSFVVPYEESPAEPVLDEKRYEVISRSRLMLREGPGTNFSIVGSLQPGQRVAATPYDEQWSSIDVEGDGLIDGFAASAYLKKIV